LGQWTHAHWHLYQPTNLWFETERMVHKIPYPASSVLSNVIPFNNLGTQSQNNLSSFVTWTIHNEMSSLTACEARYIAFVQLLDGGSFVRLIFPLFLTLGLFCTTLPLN